MRDKKTFRFKQFNIHHHRATMKVGTDGVILGAWATTDKATRILDIGTGTGLIALMLAQRTLPTVHIDAIEISADDCAVAYENVKQSPWPEKVNVHHVALQEYFSKPYDLIVSNPPFFINSYKPPTEKRTQARHSEMLSQQDLLFHSKRLLSPTGKLCVVLPETEANQLIGISTPMGWYCTRLCRFRARSEKPVERLFMEFSLEEQPTEQHELVLYRQGAEWTEEYKMLTGEFYLQA
ncbi:MAG: methyltransferase [Cytophagales bacterium]|nr:methyltransferase [Cytophagales bacterium]